MNAKRSCACHKTKLKARTVWKTGGWKPRTGNAGACITVSVEAEGKTGTVDMAFPYFARAPLARGQLYRDVTVTKQKIIRLLDFAFAKVDISKFFTNNQHRP